MDWSKIEQEVQYQTQTLSKQYSFKRQGGSTGSDERPNRKNLSSVTSEPQKKVINDLNLTHISTILQDINELKLSNQQQQTKISSFERNLIKYNDIVDTSYFTLSEKINYFEEELIKSQTSQTNINSIMRESTDLVISTKDISSKLKSLEDVVYQMNGDYTTKNSLMQVVTNGIEQSKHIEIDLIATKDTSRKIQKSLDIILESLFALSDVSQLSNDYTKNWDHPDIDKLVVHALRSCIEGVAHREWQRHREASKPSSNEIAKEIITFDSKQQQQQYKPCIPSAAATSDLMSKLEYCMRICSQIDKTLLENARTQLVSANEVRDLRGGLLAAEKQIQVLRDGQRAGRELVSSLQAMQQQVREVAAADLLGVRADLEQQQQQLQTFRAAVKKDLQEISSQDCRASPTGAVKGSSEAEADLLRSQQQLERRVAGVEDAAALFTRQRDQLATLLLSQEECRLQLLRVQDGAAQAQQAVQEVKKLMRETEDEGARLDKLTQQYLQEQQAEIKKVRDEISDFKHSVTSVRGSVRRELEDALREELAAAEGQRERRRQAEREEAEEGARRIARRLIEMETELCAVRAETGASAAKHQAELEAVRDKSGVLDDFAKRYVHESSSRFGEMSRALSEEVQTAQTAGQEQLSRFRQTVLAENMSHQSQVQLQLQTLRNDYKSEVEAYKAFVAEQEKEFDKKWKDATGLQKQSFQELHQSLSREMKKEVYRIQEESLPLLEEKLAQRIKKECLSMSEEAEAKLVGERERLSAHTEQELIRAKAYLDRGQQQYLVDTEEKLKRSAEHLLVGLESKQREQLLRELRGMQDEFSELRKRVCTDTEALAKQTLDAEIRRQQAQEAERTEDAQQRLTELLGSVEQDLRGLTQSTGAFVMHLEERFRCEINGTLMSELQRFQEAQCDQLSACAAECRAETTAARKALEATVLRDLDESCKQIRATEQAVLSSTAAAKIELSEQSQTACRQSERQLCDRFESWCLAWQEQQQAAAAAKLEELRSGLELVQRDVNSGFAVRLEETLQQHKTSYEDTFNEVVREIKRVSEERSEQQFKKDAECLEQALEYMAEEVRQLCSSAAAAVQQELQRGGQRQQKKDEERLKRLDDTLTSIEMFAVQLEREASRRSYSATTPVATGRTLWPVDQGDSAAAAVSRDDLTALRAEVVSEAATLVSRLHSTRDAQAAAAAASPTPPTPSARFYGDNKPYLSVFRAPQPPAPAAPSSGPADEPESGLFPKVTAPPPAQSAASVADLFDLTLDLDQADRSTIGPLTTAPPPLEGCDLDDDKSVDSSVSDIIHMENSCDTSIDMF